MSEPIYQKIMNLLREEINDMESNTPILSERELEKKFQASRMTVRKAVDLLVEDGYLYRVQNVGTFVADKKLHKQGMTKEVLESFDTSKNYKILLFKVKENNELAEKVGINKGEMFVQIIRLNLSQDGQPESIDEIYIYKQLIEEMNLQDIHKILEFSAKLNKGSVNQIFIPRIVPIEYANLLKIKIGTPIIQVDSKVNTQSGRVYAYIQSFRNPEKTIEITL